MQHPLTEAGAHTLVCTVYYIDDFGQEERNLSKGFNFRVSQPLSIKAVKIYTVKVPRQCGEQRPRKIVIQKRL